MKLKVNASLLATFQLLNIGIMNESASIKTSIINDFNISQPEGGGTIKGIGDTFQPNIFSGIGSYSITIPITPARGFEPELSLDYSSGSGNSAFGIGANLSIPQISIRTGKGIPKYEGNDIFLNNSIELVPKDTQIKSDNKQWDIYEYHPRIESAFSLIEHHINRTTQESFWKITSTNNEISSYGSTNESRISNPDNPTQIFSWLIDRSEDPKGNKIIYTYKSENKINIPEESWEVNRSFNNRYIKSIKYGNYFDKNENEKFAYEVVFDYGEHDIAELDKGGKDPYNEVNKWWYRPDAFSSYLSGFEIRTCRLCHNVLLFHHFEDEIGAPCLIKSTVLKYKQTQKYQKTSLSVPSQISEVTLIGYRREGRLSGDRYQIRQIPPIKLGFSEFSPPKFPEFKELKIDKKDIPGYLGVSGFQTIDLYREGITGLLYQSNDSVYYCESEGDGNFSFPSNLKYFPIDKNFEGGTVSLVDLEGNGEINIAIRDGARNGFYKRETDGTWKNFASFETYPTNIETDGYEMVGLSNNGKTDALLTDKHNLLIYPSLGKKGYSNLKKNEKPSGFPSIKEGCVTEYVGFVNIFSDGLSHRLRISDGNVECWPNLGYGNFGEKIILGNAPRFGADFDISRLFLADIDGSGTTDILYVYSNRIELFINNNGNFFSDPIKIYLPEQYTNRDQINFSDILGNGTTCLVFTKAGTEFKHYYYNFIGETVINGIKHKIMKPYLLNLIDNNLGAEIQIQYCSSTKFYLEDKKKGTPWATKLPFPVQLVERKIIYDKITNSIYAQHFKYHDGYFDHTEKTFRGFGFVESWDTEEHDYFKELENNKSLNFKSVAKESNIPPIYTKTWHHTGTYYQKEIISAHYKGQYFKGDRLAYNLPDSIFGKEIYQEDSETIRQAYASLSGTVLRVEVYSNDKDLSPDKYMNPYTVEESNVEVKLYQPKGENEYAVFMVNNREGISCNYERNPDDPCVSQNFTLETDIFGNILKSCSINLPRRSSENPDICIYPEQQSIKGVSEVKRYTTHLPKYLYCKNECDIQKLELIGLDLKGKLYFDFNEIKTQTDAAFKKIIPYGDSITSNELQVQQISWNRIYFWNEEQTNSLPLGEISAKALLHHKEKAIFSESFIRQIFDNKISTETIQNYGGYLWDENTKYWWNKGLVQYYFLSDNNMEFSMPFKTENSFEEESSPLFVKTTVEYDNYYFIPIVITKLLDKEISQIVNAKIDYISNHPRQITDINNNITQIIYDPLWQVVVISMFGKEKGETTGGMTLYPDGETPAEYKLQEEKPSFSDVINNPQNYLQGSGSYFYYNLNSWVEEKQPASSINLIRQNYWHNKEQEAPYCQTIINYNDGLGRKLETKQYVDPGVSYICDKNGAHILDENNNAVMQNTNLRWKVSGKVVYNNKEKPFAEYLPYFSNIPEYEKQMEITGSLYKTIRYDPLEREIKIISPKGFFSKIEFSPWEEVHYDENDTIIDSKYYKENYPDKLSPDEVDAIDKAVKYYNTPRIKVIDNMGAVLLDVQNNLGNIPKNIFDDIVKETSITSEEVWNELKLKKYLISDDVNLQFTWLTKKFRPHTKGFRLDIDDKFSQLIDSVTAILKQNEHIYYYETDILNRVTRHLDPRFYYSNVLKDTKYYNFIYKYPMEEEESPVFIDSIDAGKEKYLKNIFESQFWSWSARNYCQLITYDRLNRKSQLRVKKIVEPNLLGSFENFNLAEVYTYGEKVSDGIDRNLNGQLYELKDLSGVITNNQYSMQNEVLETSRQMLKDYHIAIDWSQIVLLEEQKYISKFYFNAIKQLTKEEAPDSSNILNSYNQAGQLIAVDVEFTDKSRQGIIKHIDYNAQGKKILTKHGNLTHTSCKYEESTQRLVSIKTSRPNVAGSNASIQDVEYFYDAVGNITRTRDNSMPVVFSMNQMVEPLSDYTYDALYRLVKATGRQHQGITNRSKNSIQGDGFKQNIGGVPPSINDANKLENYIENYTYDGSTNLIKRQHIAVSASWTKNTEVEDNSNRLKDLEYDASGNLRKLDVNSGIKLSYSCCENMVKAVIIERSEKSNDSDYYLYDSGEQRTRKVSERMTNDGNSISVEDKIYLGNYEIKRNYSISQNQTTTLKSERYTLRVMDDNTCVAVIYSFSADNQTPEKEDTRQTRFQLGNYLDSISLEIDKDAQIITYEEYFPYGGTAIMTGSSQSEVKLKEYRYAGKEYDDSTGLYYYGARYYAPWLGRWLIPDPEGGKDGPNVYCFVGGNPITATDQEGKWKYIPFFGGAYCVGKQSYQIASARGYTGLSLASLTFGGGLFGGAVGLVGGAIATSCLPMAQTLSMAFTSTVTSSVLSYFSGGDIKTNLGAVNINWSTRTVDYPGKAGNTAAQNNALIRLGRIVNTPDLTSLFTGGGVNVELVTEFNPKDMGSLLCSHSAIVGENINISAGPLKLLDSDVGMVNIFISLPGEIWNNYHNTSIGFGMPINNVSKSMLERMSSDLHTASDYNILTYSLGIYSCVAYAGNALLSVGMPTWGAFSVHPYVLATIIARDKFFMQSKQYG